MTLKKLFYRYFFHNMSFWEKVFWAACCNDTVWPLRKLASKTCTLPGSCFAVRLATSGYTNCSQCMTYYYYMNIINVVKWSQFWPISHFVKLWSLKRVLSSLLSLSRRTKRRLSTWCCRKSAVFLGSAIKVKTKKTPSWLLMWTETWLLTAEPSLTIPQWM